MLASSLHKVTGKCLRFLMRMNHARFTAPAACSLLVATHHTVGVPELPPAAGSTFDLEDCTFVQGVARPLAQGGNFTRTCPPAPSGIASSYSRIGHTVHDDNIIGMHASISEHYEVHSEA